MAAIAVACWVDTTAVKGVGIFVYCVLVFRWVRGLELVLFSVEVPRVVLGPVLTGVAVPGWARPRSDERRSSTWAGR
jgi:hypothetical protein